MADISIIVPAYNESSRIIRCLESIKNQTYQDFIAYIVDDGSIDDTAEIIKSFIKDDSRFVYLFQKNGGLGSARNFGMTNVKTDYITFIDSDDYISKEYIEKLIKPLKEGADVSVCYFTRVYKNKESINSFSINDIKLAKHPSAWAKAYKFNIIKKNNILFPEDKIYYEDLYFFTTLLPYVENIALIKEPLYYYMQNPNSIMYSYNDKIFDIYKIFDMIEKQIDCTDELEYIEIYHVLIGTVYRASFMAGFNTCQLKKTYNNFLVKFPNWHNNKYIKQQLPFFYKVYLSFLWQRHFRLVSFILKKLNKHVKL